MPAVDLPDPWSPRWRADCSRCSGLCCMIPAFGRSADFAIDKPAGVACPNLTGEHRCSIHDHLRASGFAGCVVYDCFGAGQQVTQVVLGGRPWSHDDATAALAAAVFPVVRFLHELLRYAAEALAWPSSDPLRPALVATVDELEALVASPAGSLAALDVDAVRADVNRLLLACSERRRADAPARDVDLRGADLVGGDLRGRDLRGASLRGAVLVGADLRGADLRGADVIGADLRGADLRGADLRGALFLVPAQLEAATGDAGTLLVPPFTPPAHWPTATG